MKEIKKKQIDNYQCDKYKEFIRKSNKVIRQNPIIQFRLGWCMEIDLKGIKNV